MNDGVPGELSTEGAGAKMFTLKDWAERLPDAQAESVAHEVSICFDTPLPEPRPFRQRMREFLVDRIWRVRKAALILWHGECLLDD